MMMLWTSELLDKVWLLGCIHLIFHGVYSLRYFPSLLEIGLTFKASPRTQWDSLGDHPLTNAMVKPPPRPSSKDSKVPKTRWDRMDMMLLPQQEASFFGPHIKGGFFSTHDCPLLRSNSFIRPWRFSCANSFTVDPFATEKIAGKVYMRLSVHSTRKKLEKDELWPRSGVCLHHGCLFFNCRTEPCLVFLLVYRMCRWIYMWQFQKKGHLRLPWSCSFCYLSHSGR